MSRDDEAHQKASVLVVDDTPANLQLLVSMLKEHGIKARPVPSGELALRAVRANPPDLILLDITMPEMDGYEVLARLRQDPLSQDIPVLFISALSETTDKLKAFQAGGVDYVTKPFQFEEVMARVRTHLELRRQKLELRRSYDQLRELERLREDLTNMVVHDMRSPLLGLQLTLDLLAMSDEGTDAERTLMIDTAKLATAGLAEMVNQVLDMSRLESGRLDVKRSKCDVVELVRAAVTSARMLSGSRTVTVEGAPSAVAEVDPDLVRRVVSNLLGNALKFTAEDGRVTLGVHADPGTVRVEVSDNGLGIAPENQQRVFDKYVQVEGPNRRKGSGLGLAFSKMAVEAHGGSIGVRSALGVGSTFHFTLPVMPPGGP
jgi:signal transduction histidine kinase